MLEIMKALFCVISVAVLIISGLEVIERGAPPRPNWIGFMGSRGRIYPWFKLYLKFVSDSLSYITEATNEKKINPKTRLCCWIRFEFFFVARLRQTATSRLVKDGQHHHRHLQRSLHPLHSLNTNLGSFTSLSNLKGRTKKANATSQWRDHQNWDKVFIIHFTASMIFFLKHPRCWSGRGLKPWACSAD